MIHIDPKENGETPPKGINLRWEQADKPPDLGVRTPVSNKPTCPIISWGYSAESKSPKENAGKPYVWWYKLQDI